MTRGTTQWLARLFVVLLLAGTALLVVGVAVERNQPHDEGTSSETQTGSGESGEEPSHADKGSTSSAIGETASSEEIFGVDPPRAARR